MVESFRHHPVLLLEVVGDGPCQSGVDLAVEDHDLAAPGPIVAFSETAATE